jgi:hypothetical protein
MDAGTGDLLDGTVILRGLGQLKGARRCMLDEIYYTQYVVWYLRFPL